MTEAYIRFCGSSAFHSVHSICCKRKTSPHSQHGQSGPLFLRCALHTSWLASSLFHGRRLNCKLFFSASSLQYVFAVSRLYSLFVVSRSICSNAWSQLVLASCLVVWSILLDVLRALVNSHAFVFICFVFNYRFTPSSKDQSSVCSFLDGLLCRMTIFSFNASSMSCRCVSRRPVLWFLS